MNHLRARRRLASLLDDFLEPGVEREVRAHLSRCAACRRELSELEADEALLRRVPASMVPMAVSGAADARLRTLARWARREPRRSYHPIPVALATALGLALLIMGSLPQPSALASQDAPRTVVVASRMPMTFVAAPVSVGETTGAFPATLRH